MFTGIIQAIGRVERHDVAPATVASTPAAAFQTPRRPSVRP